MRGEPTEPKPRQETPPASEGAYRTLFEQCAEAVVLYDAETRRVLDANPAFLHLLGYTPAELEALTVYDVVGHSRPGIDTIIGQSVHGGSARVGKRLWRTKAGLLVDVDVTVGRLRHGGREIVFGIARQLSDAAERASLRPEPRAPRAAGRTRRGGGAGQPQGPSRREGQVLRLLAQGFSNRQIGTRLKLSVKTVETFRARLYKKLGLRGRPALVRYALRAGLLTADDFALEHLDTESRRET